MTAAVPRSGAAQHARPEVDAIVRADHGDPFAVLGLHEDPGGRLVLRCMLPRAKTVRAVDPSDGSTLAELERIHPEGFFEGIVPGRRERFAYRFRVDLPEGEVEIEDPYRFGPWLGQLDVHLLAEGNHLRNYDKLGARPTVHEGVAGVVFCVWAPSARKVSVVGDFNDWDGRVHPMRLRHECGVWEIFLPGLTAGIRYKYEIRGPDGELVPLKADPYAFAAEQPPRTASVVYGLPSREWRDTPWIESRIDRNSREAPISIYEVHLGSWRRTPEEGNRYLTYGELAESLVAHVKALNFTHIELLPVSEYPFDGSWGYQPIGLYAPTSRFGTPEDFQCFVEHCHREGVGVLLDWVPGHFPTDAHGLGRFDGTCLYEHADPRQGFHQDWNTLIYNYGRREVRNFLLGNALYWMERFHLDGLRVDAVASMLYLDYSRKEGEWVPNRYGGRENLEAIELLQRMNTEIFGRYPGATTIAEESTAWPAVSRPVYAGGLGFGFKWNMGFMNDTLRYMSHEAVHRKFHHRDITFGLLYAFSENFVLPLSHDEVVHGKRSLINKMSGDEWQRFANLRTYYAFMWGYPGKKLLFMGQEFAQLREWSEERGLDWHLLENPAHDGIRRLIQDLNRVYRELPALHARDCEGEGFEWLIADDDQHSVFAWERKAPDEPSVVVISNFTPVPRDGYVVPMPRDGTWREAINTDADIYGGSGKGNGGKVVATGGKAEISLPPLATLILEYTG